MDDLNKFLRDNITQRNFLGKGNHHSGFSVNNQNTVLRIKNEDVKKLQDEIDVSITSHDIPDLYKGRNFGQGLNIYRVNGEIDIERAALQRGKNVDNPSKNVMFPDEETKDIIHENLENLKSMSLEPFVKFLHDISYANDHNIALDNHWGNVKIGDENIGITDSNDPHVIFPYGENLENVISVLTYSTIRTGKDFDDNHRDLRREIIYKIVEAAEQVGCKVGENFDSPFSISIGGVGEYHTALRKAGIVGEEARELTERIKGIALRTNSNEYNEMVNDYSSSGDLSIDAITNPEINNPVHSPRCHLPVSDLVHSLSESVEIQTEINLQGKQTSEPEESISKEQLPKANEPEL